MKIADLRQLSAAELDRTLREQRGELLALRLKQSTSTVENSARFRQLRQGIARILTLQRQQAAAAPAK